MKKLFVLSALFAVGVMAETLSGVISDDHCGAKHSDGSGSACVKTCVKQGAAAVFVSDGKVYKISDSSKDKVANHLGDKVKVDGKVDGDTITIDTITMESGS